MIRGLEMRERLGELRIKVQAVGDAELEVWAAHRQADALEEALGRKVRIEKVPYRNEPSAGRAEAARQNAAVGRQLPRRGR